MKLFETRIREDSLGKINKVLLEGNIGFGEDVSVLENEFSLFSNKEYNVATNSASAAAFMIFAFLREKYGICDVYTTSLGFISPVWAAKHFEHNIIFVDSNEDLQFDVQDYCRQRRDRCGRYTDKGITPVVMPVLYGGVSTIKGFDDFFSSSEYKEIIVVDSAHCATPTIKSDFLFFSFHPYKPICAADGGMISTDEVGACEYFRLYKNFGRINTKRGYDVTQNGFKFYMNNLNAVLGLISLRDYRENLKIRKHNFNILRENFKFKEIISHDKMSSYYFATIYCQDSDKIMKKMTVTKHYPLLHQMTYFEKEKKRTLNNLEKVYDKITNIPIHQNLSEEDLNKIIEWVGM